MKAKIFLGYTAARPKESLGVRRLSDLSEVVRIIPRRAPTFARQPHRSNGPDQQGVMMNEHYFYPIQPQQVFTDARMCLHFCADDPTTLTGKHYITLVERGYFIFVTAYQTAGASSADRPSPTNALWLGGTQLELHTSGLQPLITALELHHAHVQHLSLRNQAVFKYTKTCAGERLSLSRDYAVPGYRFMNHARKTHQPWADDAWKQELRLPDNLLFEQGYGAALKKIAAHYPPE
jgi:hypothetical protein